LFFRNDLSALLDTELIAVHISYVKNVLYEV